MKRERENTIIILENCGRLSEILFEDKATLEQLARLVDKYPEGFIFDITWKDGSTQSLDVLEVLFDNNFLNEIGVRPPTFIGLPPNTQ